MHRFIRHAFALLLVAATAAGAQTYPDRPIKLVVGAPPGGSGDLVARVTAEKLSKSLGQPVVVDNRPGAGGVLGVKTVLSAKPDGHTLLLFFADNLTIAPLLARTPPYDSLKDLQYVGAVARSNSFFLAVNPKVPAQTFDEFLKLAKSASKKISYSTYGLGSYPQLSFEIFSSRAGLDMLHVPYKGGVESQQAAVAGTVDAVSAINIVELIKGGKLRALAVGGTKRSPHFPSVPTFNELGFGDQIFGPVVYGVAAPAGTPPQIVQLLSAEVRRIAEAPDMAEKLAPIVTEPYAASGEQITTMVKNAMEVYRPIIQRLGLDTP
jgi:tripartite-type tricarboxylate transporter receptor subunit TctC